VADSLKKSGQYREAALAYEKQVYFASSNAEKAGSLLNKAGCLKEIGLYSDAQKSLLRANYTDLSDSLVFALRYQTALCAYLAADFSTAESQLLQAIYFTRDSVFKRQALLLHALVLNETQQWKQAEEHLLEYVSYTSAPQTIKDSISFAVKKMYGKDNIPHLKKMKKAQTLSALMPGTGQMYAGYFGEGLANLSFQLAALAFTGFNVYTHYYVTSLFIGYSIFQKFYLGGINRVEFLVNKKNYQLTRAFNEKNKQELILPMMLLN
jgi:tetratricopeptide (TPR) repeat protein